MPEVKCSLCGYYSEEKFFHTQIKDFAVCYCCYSDMNFETETAFHKFCDALNEQISKSNAKPQS